MRVSTLSGVVMEGGMSVVIFIRGAARTSTFVCAFTGTAADIISELTPSLNASRRFMAGTPLTEGNGANSATIHPASRRPSLTQIKPMSASGHSRPIDPVSPAGSCPLHSKNDPI